MLASKIILKKFEKNILKFKEFLILNVKQAGAELCQAQHSLS